MQQDKRFALPLFRVVQSHAIDLDELTLRRVRSLSLPIAVVYEECGGGKGNAHAEDTRTGQGRHTPGVSCPNDMFAGFFHGAPLLITKRV
jgi:hypothetical protein